MGVIEVAAAEELGGEVTPERLAEIDAAFARACRDLIDQIVRGMATPRRLCSPEAVDVRKGRDGRE